MALNIPTPESLVIAQSSRFVHFVFCALCVLVSDFDSRAETARIELHVLATTNLSDEQFLTGAKNDEMINIGAELRLPVRSPGRVPAIVLVHGSAGVGGSEDRWSRELNDLGIATFMLDAFTGRGISNTGVDQSQLGNLTMINDAYRALELLASHPRIDPQRIGLMGESRGGRVALYASLKRFQRMHGPAGVEFAVYLPFYAPCYTTYIDDIDIAARPIRLFHGSADDYAPVAPCRAYAERLRKAGVDVQLFEYTGAHHAFDNPVVQVRSAAQNQTARACSLREVSPGMVVNQDTNQPFTWEDPCVERGVTVGYDAAAHSQAIRDVTMVLQEVFKLGAPP